jgi:chemotaxis signal transduction protein
VQTILLPIGAELYALPIDWVREVVAAPTVTRLATAPASVLGLINLRGEIVPLLDTVVLLGVGRCESIAFAVVVNTPHGPGALAATGFPQRAELDTQVTPSELPGTAGIHQFDRRAVVMLDPATLLTAERLGGHASHPAAMAIGAL